MEHISYEIISLHTNNDFIQSGNYFLNSPLAFSLTKPAHQRLHKLLIKLVCWIPTSDDVVSDDTAQRVCHH